jgi:membrane protein
VLRRAWRESKADHVSLLAGGVAYAAFLALFPAMIAAVMLYGLVADPADVTRQVEDLAKALPSDAQSLLETQMRGLVEGSSSTLGIGLVIALAAALWAAAGGINGLIEAVNIAYDEVDDRGFLKKRAVALLLTLGGIVFFAVAVTLVAVAPAVFDAIGLGSAGRVVAESLRWIGLVIGVMVALALLYRIAPDRDAPKLRWVSLGAVIATVIWVLASLGFSLYVDNFGKYAKTYGALAGVVVLMLWLYLSAYIVLLGAEINAESEQQTVRDTTKGEPQPLGQRNAVKADSVPEPQER